MKTIFISHSNQNSSTAKALIGTLGKAFEGQIHFYLAINDITTGLRWKPELKEKLLEYDAVISLVTPDFIEQPWFFVEWTPFWLRDKPCYLLLSDDVTPNNLFGLMRDDQTGKITNREDLQKFFKALHKLAGGQPNVAYDDYAADLAARISETLQEEKLYSYQKYLSPKQALPHDFPTLSEILIKFYNDGNIEAVRKVSGRIKNDRLEFDVARNLLSSGYTDLAIMVSEHINAANYLREILIQLVKLNIFGHEAHRTVYPEGVADAIVRMTGKIDNDVWEFDVAVSALKSQNIGLAMVLSQNIKSDTYLRDLAMELIRKNAHHTSEFQEMVKRIRNADDLVKIGEAMAELNYQNETIFEHIIGIVSEKSRSNLAENLAKRGQANGQIFKIAIDTIRSAVYLENIAAILVNTGQYKSANFNNILVSAFHRNKDYTKRILEAVRKTDANYVMHLYTSQLSGLPENDKIAKWMLANGYDLNNGQE